MVLIKKICSKCGTEFNSNEKIVNYATANIIGIILLIINILEVIIFGIPSNKEKGVLLIFGIVSILVLISIIILKTKCPKNKFLTGILIAIILFILLIAIIITVKDTIDNYKSLFALWVIFKIFEF